MKLATKPENQTPTEGDAVTVKAVIELEAGEESAKCAYTWKRDGEEVDKEQVSTDAEKLTSTFSKNQVTKDDAGSYTFEVSYDNDPNPKVSSPFKITVKKVANDTAPLVWDADFALASFVGTVVVFLGLVIPTVVAASKLVTGSLQFSGIVAIELVAVGTALVLLGCWMAVLELRGRATLAATPPAPAASRDVAAEVAKVAPDLVKNFGGLQGFAAVLLVGAAALISAAVIASGALPKDPSDKPDATGGTSTTTSAPPTPTQ